MKSVCLILGFFDGVHKGHSSVISSAVDFARQNSSRTVLITFRTSPAVYFNSKVEYIYPREVSYNIIKKLGVDYIVEKDFSELVNITAQDYLKSLFADFTPISISTGFNHTFGHNREGNAEFLEKYQNEYNYKYFCAPAYYSENEVVSSTLIKKYLKAGNLIRVNEMLTEPYTIESEVVHGQKLGRKLGFPTANMMYPADCVKIPHGVYLVSTSFGKGVLNWGVKPTLDSKSEVLEVHIPGFEKNIYGEKLKIQILKKIRDEKKFSSLDELKEQINKDVKECLEL